MEQIKSAVDFHGNNTIFTIERQIGIRLYAAHTKFSPDHFILHIDSQTLSGNVKIGH